jgi:hypothetical protein
MSGSEAGDASRGCERNESVDPSPLGPSVENRSEGVLTGLFSVRGFGLSRLSVESRDAAGIEVDGAFRSKESRSTVGELRTGCERQGDIEEGFACGSFENGRGDPSFDFWTHGPSLGEGLPRMDAVFRGLLGKGNNLGSSPRATRNDEGEASQVGARAKLCM